MKARLRYGKHIVNDYLLCDYKHVYKGKLISMFTINFRDKYTYIDFIQNRNHLIIKTSEGDVDYVFCGEIPVLSFLYF